MIPATTSCFFPISRKMIFSIAALVVYTSAALAEERLALLIGNQEYSNAVGGRLKNPFNDVALVQKALEQDGFKIKTVKDATFVDIQREVTNFSYRVAEGGKDAIAFFYYSGHGLARSNDHVNFLIPVNAKDPADENFWYESIPMDFVISTLRGNAPMASLFIIFDACRNELRLPTKGLNKGFVPELPRSGTFIAFSTSPNESASDSGETSGPYALALASELQRRGQDHLSVFQNVREKVFFGTHNQQTPTETGQLLGRVYFAGRELGGREPEPTAPTTKSPAMVAACADKIEIGKRSLAEVKAQARECLR